MVASAPGASAASPLSSSSVFELDPNDPTTPRAGTRLVHNLSPLAPSANPSYLAYTRNTYGFAAQPLYLEANLDAGTTPGTASHLIARNGNDNFVDVYVTQDGRVGYHIKDGAYEAAAVAGQYGTAKAQLRAVLTPDGLTLSRDGGQIARVPHSFANRAGDALQLAGTSTAPVAAGNVLAYADDVTITNDPAALQTPLPAQPDLTVSALTASQDRPGQTQLSVTVRNGGQAPAANVTVRFLDGAQLVGDAAPLASLAPGASLTLSLSWNTRAQNGTHTLTAIADPGNTVAESNETNNQTQQTVTIRGNKVSNGSFEQGSSASSADGWSTESGGGYSGNASDGSRAASASGTGNAAGLRNPSWTSSAFPVTPGQTYGVAMTVTSQGASSAPQMQVAYLDAAGHVLSQTTALAAGSPLGQAIGQVIVPAGASQARLTLLGFSPLDPATSGTVNIDDVWFW